MRGRLQAYPLSNITLVELSQQTFIRDARIARQIDTDPTLWRSGMIEVLLKASASIAINFQHRPLLPEQEIVKTLDDGALLLSSRARCQPNSARHQILDAGAHRDLARFYP